MKSRKDYENEIKHAGEFLTATLSFELLLDIRDLLFSINENQGVSKWGPKINNTLAPIQKEHQSE